ncbi:MAG: hypothetical protein Hens3KO_10930 [Henriciella sp.]
MRKLVSAMGVSLFAIAACETNIMVPPVSEAAQADTSVIDGLVSTQAEYMAAIKVANPGDTIVLANGTWVDFDLVFEAQGTAENPITLRAETPGRVILSGQSSLRLAGEHLIVSGLVFKNGFTPLNEVISFRKDSKNLANNSRVTETVIENYSNPDRTQRDMWVVMYGRGNEFDHNHISGKLNSGPTMAVRLNGEESQQNSHYIHHNYFGPRPVFGSNGGETFRIGTSQYSLTQSNSVVENNFFDRCSGEVEIISNKSGGNTFRGNTFYESRGTLTLRHGNGTLVENNLFDGNGARYTGGVRVINAQQTIQNNYFKDLTGIRFSGALVVMNGVPDSPINRYHQVNEAVITNNTFDNIASIELGEGSDAERSAVPINSAFSNNIVIGASETSPFNLYDDMSGMAFSGNIAEQTPPDSLAGGFKVQAAATSDDLIPAMGGAGASGDFGIARDKTGVSWYPKAPYGSPFEGGETVSVEPGTNAIFDAVREANSGDTLELQPGTYTEAKTITLTKPITIKAAGDAPLIQFERRNLFLLSGNGSLRLDGVEVTGELAPDNVGNSFLAATPRGGGGNHTLKITNSAFRDFTVNRSFAVVTAEKGTFFDKVSVSNSRFSDISGTAFKMDSETDDFGIYNIEHLLITDSQFERVQGGAASIYRGGRDESTFGPLVEVETSNFKEVGTRLGATMRLHGAQNLRFYANATDTSPPIEFIITTGKPNVFVEGNRVVGSNNTAFLSTKDMR